MSRLLSVAGVEQGAIRNFITNSSRTRQVDQATGVVDALKNNGQLGRMDGFIGGTPQSPVKQWEERFSYDSLGRLDLAGEYRGDDGSLSWQADYDYDRYGNRTSVSGIGTPSFTTSYNTATNRIATAGISYDAAGQTLSDSIFAWAAVSIQSGRQAEVVSQSGRLKPVYVCL